MGNGVLGGGGTPPASTITERMPTATIKERVMRTRDPQSGRAHVVDSRYNAGRSGPHAHRNAARQVVDHQRAEVHGQQKPSDAVQGPVKKQQPDGMLHRGGIGACARASLWPPPPPAPHTTTSL